MQKIQEDKKKLNQNTRLIIFSIIAGLTAFLMIVNTLTSNNSYVDSTSIIATANAAAAADTNNDNIPTAKSVYNTGIMSLPPSVKGVIIYIPDEAHEPLKENRTISIKNAHYIPSNLLVSAGTSIAFIHGDPNHVHIEIIKGGNSTINSGKVVWQTTPVKNPGGGSDVKVLPLGSYNISDEKYAPMTGAIKVVDGGGKQQQSTGNNLVVGGIFVPTGSLKEYKSDFAAAGFQILSEYNFLSKVVQKDIAGPTTLLIYSTANMNLQDSIAKLKPIIESLPYR
jgi:hypothetical protein